MAARRVARTAIDWHALGEKVPARQKDVFRMLKANTDKYVNKLSELPEELPKIDFAEYRKRVANAAFVNEFEKLYNSLEIPYPRDTANVSETLKAAEKVELQKKDTFVAESNIRKKELSVVLSAMDSVPPPEKMTRQMFNHYFPEAAINPNRENPGFYPQYRRQHQFDSEEFGPYLNTIRDRKDIYTLEETETKIRMEYEEKKRELAKQLAEEKKEAAKKLN